MSFNRSTDDVCDFTFPKISARKPLKLATFLDPEYYTNELYKWLEAHAHPDVFITPSDIGHLKFLIKNGATLSPFIFDKTIIEWPLLTQLGYWSSKAWPCVKAIIEATGECNHPDRKMMLNFFLEKAVLYRQLDMAHYLLKQGADFKEEHVTFAKNNKNEAMLKLLEKSNPNPKTPNPTSIIKNANTIFKNTTMNVTKLNVTHANVKTTTPTANTKKSSTCGFSLWSFFKQFSCFNKPKPENKKISESRGMKI